MDKHEIEIEKKSISHTRSGSNIEFYIEYRNVFIDHM